MKLYFSPGACSLAARIILHETGTPFTAVKVDLGTKKTEDGSDYLRINPRGAVPAIEITPGVVLTQNVAVLQYIGDNSGVEAFRPPAGSLERGRLEEAIGFCGDLHSAIGALFSPDLPDDLKKRFAAGFHRRMEQLEAFLPDGSDYWLPWGFTQADAYLAVMLRWPHYLGLDISGYPKAVALRDRVFARPAAQVALKEDERA